MKIAIDVTGSLYQGTGVATYYNSLVPELLEIETEHEFLLFGYSLRARKELRLATKVFPIPPSLANLIWNRLHVLKIERLIGPIDVFHAWDYIQPPTQKAKLVTTIHDLTPILFPKQHHPRTVSAYQAGINWVKKQANAVIADSIATKEDIINLLKIPEENIHVIYLAASRVFHEFREKHANTRDMSIEQVKKKYAIAGEYILCVGTQEPRKNLERAVKAYEALGTEQQLIIVGRFGWGRKIRPVRGVKILGYVPGVDLPPLYAGASCFLYPSLYEGFGLPLLEAMAVGTPVVTSDRGSIKEVAGNVAVTVNPESVEAIAFGINVALKRGKELSQKGVLHSQTFSWERTALQTLEVYEKIGRQDGE